MPEDTPQIWERQPCDTSESWLAYTSYRDRPHPRSLDMVASYQHGTILQVRRWYTDHNWGPRVASYDAFLDKLILEERHAAMKVMAKDVAAQHVQLLAAGRHIVHMEFERWREVMMRSGSAPGSVMKPSQLLALAEFVLKGERLVHGEVTERIGMDEGKVDLSKFTEEQLEKYEELLALASAKEAE